jgi:hypothetical protein
MTSLRQIEANRRNASKSTGPTTAQGKQRSSRNALRHGLTAETVVGAIESAEDYADFEAAIAADYDALSAVERELVLRLASLLWRLRRATSMETGLFEVQAGDLTTFGAASRPSADSRQINFSATEQMAVEPMNDVSVLAATEEPQRTRSHNTETSSGTTDPAVTLARCFLTLPNFAIDRLNRYEVALWRQVGQTLFALDALDRRKPQERTPRPRDQQELRNYRRDER